jgi:Uncharacterised nucleotidyltransferase
VEELERKGPVPEAFIQLSSEKMQHVADLLFTTARARITTEDADRLRVAVRKDVNWIYLAWLAIQHETTALLYRNLQSACPNEVPAIVMASLAASFRAQEKEVAARSEELVHILGEFEKQGVFAVAYKGPILSQRLYGDPALREFSEGSDLDIMVHQCDLMKAHEILATQAYRLAFLKPSEVNEYARTNRELHFCREQGGNRALELHWRFMVRSARLQDDPDRFLRRFEIISFAGRKVRSLPPEVYLLILCLHGTKHKWRKLKLSCDIAEILKLGDLDWQYVAREAKELGIQRLVGVGVLLAENPLGATLPDGLMRYLKIDRMSRELAADCRKRLLEPPDEKWNEEAEYEFLLNARERLRDRLGMFVWDRLVPKFTPDERDRAFASIPDSLSALYYLVRPIRMIGDKINESFRARAK